MNSRRFTSSTASELTATGYQFSDAVVRRSLRGDGVRRAGTGLGQELSVQRRQTLVSLPPIDRRHGMTGRLGHHIVAVRKKKPVAAYQDSRNFLLNHSREGFVNLA